MGIEGQVPDPSIVGSDRLQETIGSNDLTTNRFFFDKSGVLTASVTLKSAESESSPGTALIEGTDYDVDYDLGQLNLINNGTVKAGLGTLFGSYSYLKVLNNTQLQDALNRAQSRVDNDTNNHWADGSTATPDYIQVTNEKHDGKGRFELDYYLDNFPLPNVSTTLNGTVSADGTVIPVRSTAGFPESGIILIESDKISYSSKTATQFNGTAGTGHTADIAVKPFSIEISGTDPGTDPSWEVLDENDDFDIDLDTGRVHIMRNDLILNTLSTASPPRLIPYRFRANYIWGNNSILQNVKMLTLMLASKDLMHLAVRSAHAKGFNDFNPDLINVDDGMIEGIIKDLINYRSSINV